MAPLRVLACSVACLAACASNPIAAELTRLEGCWGSGGVHMRWRVDPASPGVHVGALQGADTFTLTDGEGGFNFCQGETACQAAFLGAARPTDDTPEWMQVTASAGRLVLAQHRGESVTPLFEGVRERCNS